MSAPIRPTIDHEMQPYFDEPVLVNPVEPSIIERSVRQIFDKTPPPKPIQVAWQKVKLRWVKPDGTPR